MMKSFRLCLLAKFVLVAWFSAAAGAAETPLKIATLVPKHSLYHRQLLDVGEAWKAAQGGAGKFVVYPDGSQGGEADIVRRMRIGQLQGGLLSVVGLKEIDPSIAALQSLPLVFDSWDELDHVREKLRPSIEKKFNDAGFVILAWGDAGWVRFFSRAAASRPGDYRKMKFFAWAGESEQQAIMKSLGYTPVPLETGDILPAIQTGMIDAVPFTPYFALATQIYNTAPHMLDINWAPIVGALVVTRKAWDGMSPAAQAALRSAGEKAGGQIRAKARQEVAEAVDAMKKRGLQVHVPTAEEAREWKELASSLYPRIRGRMVPAEAFDEIFAHLRAYRAGSGG
jgi:TRAP-type C4-dicarboxylate transport system substrate-binding protein